MSVVFDNDTSWSDPWPRPKSGQAKGKTSLFLFLFPPVFHLPVQFLDRPPWSTTGYCSNKTQLQPTYVKCDAGSLIEVTGGNRKTRNKRCDKLFRSALAPGPRPFAFGLFHHSSPFPRLSLHLAHLGPTPLALGGRKTIDPGNEVASQTN